MNQSKAILFILLWHYLSSALAISEEVVAPTPILVWQLVDASKKNVQEMPIEIKQIVDQLVNRQDKSIVVQNDIARRCQDNCLASSADANSKVEREGERADLRSVVSASQSAEESLSEVDKVIRMRNEEETRVNSVRASWQLIESTIASGWRQLIEKIASEYQVDSHLLATIIFHESRFNPNAISPKGAIGLMQVMPKTARRFGFSEISDPEKNIRAGTAYLKWLLNRFNNNIALVAAAYNAGEGAVQRYGGIPPYKETQRYVQKIMLDYSNSEQYFVETGPPITTALSSVPSMLTTFSDVLGKVIHRWTSSSHTIKKK